MERGDKENKGLRLLSLDGGGPGSLAQLRIIEEYTSRLSHDQGVDADAIFPADLFDAIGGVGFGAYIALLIGPLRMTIPQAIEELVTLGTILFPSDHEKPRTAEENSKKLKESIEDLLRRQQLPIDIKLTDARLPGLKCKTVIFATPCTNVAQCMPFRTYKSRERSISCTLVEAVCATLAFPSLFAPISIGLQPLERQFVTACTGFNNITREFLREATSQFGQDRRVCSIISIGAGRPSNLSLEASNSGGGDPLKQIEANGERIARELSSQLFNVEAYLRLNVEYGADNIRMDSWKNLGNIESHIDVYLQGTTVSRAIDSSLRSLQDRIGLITLGQLTRSTQIQTQAKKTPAVSPYFVIRKEYWNAMEKHLVIEPEKKRKIMVLSGMGGCGKTQMVAYFVEKYHSRLVGWSLIEYGLTFGSYQHVVFVDATSSSSICSDLQSAIRALGIGYEQKTFEDAIAFLESGSQEGNWLLILDNADDPKVDVIQYLPQCFHGTVLITTRNPDLGRLSTTAHLRLGPMGEAEAYELLTRAAHRATPLSSNEIESANQLLGELGCLAVALVQAGSYCDKMSTEGEGSSGHYTFGQYLSLFKQHRKKLMTEGDKTSLDQYTRGAYTTFDLSYTLLSPSARGLLHLSAFFHHVDISLSILEYASKKNFADPCHYLARPEAHEIIKQRLKALLKPEGQWDELYIHKIIHDLISMSLVSTTSTQETVFLRFHPLIHVWSRDVLSTSDASDYRHMAIQVLASSSSNLNQSRSRLLLPHIMALMKELPVQNLHINEQMGFGQVLEKLGLYSKAESFFTESLATLKMKLGTKDLNTLDVAEWLAVTYRKEIKLEEAEKLFLETLEQYKQVRDDDHRDILCITANLAAAYYQNSKWKEAEKMFMDLKEKNERLFGKDHEDTMVAAAYLAATYREQGKWDEAERMLLETLEQLQRLLGWESPDTFGAAAHLAATYRKQKKWKEAEKLEVQVLQRCEALMSKDHPETIKAAGNLAVTYYEQKEWEKAERIQLDVVERSERLFSKDDPRTIRAIKSLAQTYFQQRRYGEAEELQVEVVEKAQKILGNQNSETRAYIKDLGAIQKASSSTKPLVPT